MHAGQVGQHFNPCTKFELRTRCHYPIIPFGMRYNIKAGNLATNGSRFTGLLFTL